MTAPEYGKMGDPIFTPLPTGEAFQFPHFSTIQVSCGIVSRGGISENY